MPPTSCFILLDFADMYISFSFFPFHHFWKNYIIVNFLNLIFVELHLEFHKKKLFNNCNGV